MARTFPCLLLHFSFISVVHLTSSVSATYCSVCSQNSNLPTFVVSRVRDSNWCHAVKPMSRLCCEAPTLEYRPYWWIILFNCTMYSEGQMLARHGHSCRHFMGWTVPHILCICFMGHAFHSPCLQTTHCMNFLNDSHSWTACTLS